MRSMLKPYRRHLLDCPHRHKGRAWTRCNCNCWVDGRLEHQRVNHSLDTCEWSVALSKVAALSSGEIPVAHSAADCVEAWKAQLEVEPSTRRKYERLADQLAAWCAENGIRRLQEITLERLGDFRASRDIERSTSIRELHTMRQLFSWFQARGWIRDNPAKSIKPPKGKARKVMPFTEEEMLRILAACDRIGQKPYERLRAKALILVMRHTGLAIGDAIMLRRDAIQPDGYLLVHRQKTEKPVRLRVPDGVISALASLPAPRQGQGDAIPSPVIHGELVGDSVKPFQVQTGYFFWNGVISRRALVGTAERIMGSIKRSSGIPDFHAHRFRHTLAVSMLAEGASLEEVAHALGNTPKVVYDHYASWTAGRQDRLDDLMERINAEEKAVSKTIQ